MIWSACSFLWSSHIFRLCRKRTLKKRVFDHAMRGIFLRPLLKRRVGRRTGAPQGVSGASNRSESFESRWEFQWESRFSSLKARPRNGNFHRRLNSLRFSFRRSDYGRRMILCVAWSKNYSLRLRCRRSLDMRPPQKNIGMPNHCFEFESPCRRCNCAFVDDRNHISRVPDSLN